MLPFFTRQNPQVEPIHNTLQEQPSFWSYPFIAHFTNQGQLQSLPKSNSVTLSSNNNYSVLADALDEFN
jgi:hypothetical protein